MAFAQAYRRTGDNCRPSWAGSSMFVDDRGGGKETKRGEKKQQANMNCCRCGAFLEKRSVLSLAIKKINFIGSGNGCFTPNSSLVCFQMNFRMLQLASSIQKVEPPLPKEKKVPHNSVSKCQVFSCPHVTLSS